MDAPGINLRRGISGITNDLFKDGSVYQGEEMKMGNVDPSVAENESIMPLGRQDSMFHGKK